MALEVLQITSCCYSQEYYYYYIRLTAFSARQPG